MSKTLCDLKKQLKCDFESYTLLVCNPRFVCRKCGRAANKKKYLCEPEKIGEGVNNLGTFPKRKNPKK